MVDIPVIVTPCISSSGKISSEDRAIYTSHIKQILQLWREKFEEGRLTPAYFDTLWELWIPKLHSLAVTANNLNRNFNKALVENVLFKSLDDFICNGDSTTIFKQLRELDEAPSICCKTFENGSLMYICKECAKSKTSFLCAECFQNSKHRHHKYKICTSDGAGCCDCGNTEVWKKDSFCTIHVASVTAVKQTKCLPKDLTERTKIVFQSVLWYTYRLLNIEQKNIIKLGTSDDIFAYDIFNRKLFSVILYNDKDYTYSQIIKTLTSVLKCDERSAAGYATVLNREGRVILLCSTFTNCLSLKRQLKEYISESGKQPLRVLMEHNHIISHQFYAQKMLLWLEKYLEQGRSFRKIFAEILLERNNNEPSICEGFLLKNSSFWKSVRSQWQKLVISGVLVDNEDKQALADIFAKNYRPIISNLIQGDPDQTFLMFSLSIKLFTAPNLAYSLIADHDILYVLLDMLISEVTKKCNTAGKLEFGSHLLNINFKKVFYVLNDLSYLLSVIPDKWTRNLRYGFLRAIPLMLQVFTMVQGMDAIARQKGDPTEYEPDWKSGFSFHFKLADIISLVGQWCGSDKIILVKTYRYVLEKLEEHKAHAAEEPVSIHLPLTRFLAALYLSLENFNLHFRSPKLQITGLTPVQIVEPALKMQVIIAQVHAGMWRRNETSLLSILSEYRNANYRNEMLDRDITLLQTTASLMDSNTFIIHLLNKFNLFEWIKPNYDINNLGFSEENTIKQINGLVEEFLDLLIVIIGERHMPGISNITVQDRIRKEIIQYLYIKPRSHSELISTISVNLASKDVIVDEIIQELAVLKKSAYVTEKSVFELKEVYYDEFNAYFYHFTREELSVAKELQKERRKSKWQIACCPPPKLPKLTKRFALLLNLLQCDMMLYIMKTVLGRCNNLKDETCSESQFNKILYLIGYALLEEETGNYSFFNFIENAAKFELLFLLKELKASPQLRFHKGLLKWVVVKYNQVVKDKKNSIVLKTEPSPRCIKKSKGRETTLVAKRKVKLMKKINKRKNNFVKKKSTLFTGVSGKPKTSKKNDVMDVTETFNEEPVLEPPQIARMINKSTYICIICHEEDKVTSEGPLMVFAAYVRQATVLCQQKRYDILTYILQQNLLYLHTNLGPSPHIRSCGHVMHSKCWKQMNTVTEQRYRRLRQPDVTKQEFLCPLCDCLCNTVLPIIPQLSTLQPGVPNNDLTFDQWIENIRNILYKNIRLSQSSEKFKSLHCIDTICNNETCVEQYHSNAECKISWINQVSQSYSIYDHRPLLLKKFVEVFPTKSAALDFSYTEIVYKFAQDVCKTSSYVDFLTIDKTIAPMSWKSLAYTIHSMEVLLRNSNKPLLGQQNMQHEFVKSFTKVVGVIGSTLPCNVFINSNAKDLLSTLFVHDANGPSILQWDSFGYLVSLTFSLPSVLRKYVPVPIPTCGTLDAYLLKIIFICQIVKIVILLKINSDSSMESNENNDSEILEVWNIIGRKTGILCKPPSWKSIQNACLPFLRCCVLFYYYLTEGPAPAILTEIGGDTFENMCLYLDLPRKPKEHFNSPGVNQLINSWCNHTEVLCFLRNNSFQVNYEPQRVPHLIELPTDYIDLINIVSKFICPRGVTDPCVCLICGDILCSCTSDYHKTKCAVDVGIFLNIRHCKVLLLAAPNAGCFISTPYVDDYGETDRGLKRGNPLKLCLERYKKLQTLWLSHSIHEEIARSDHTVITQPTYPHTASCN